MDTINQPFEIIDHIADIGIIVRGKNLEELFARAAIGLFSLITDIKYIKSEIKREIKLVASNCEDLLIFWLNELIYLFEVEHVIFCHFRIIEMSTTKISAICLGETIKSKHHISREIKAATYHMLNITRHNNNLKAQVIFDL